MTKPQNILFIMCDQLRWDYLSCAGHPSLETPNIDRLAEKGVRFTNAYCQSPLCGPSRACFYTGRYASTTGATINQSPLRADEMLLGDYMRALDLRTALVGKTHASANPTALERLQIDPASALGHSINQNGFETFERFDGLHPDPIVADDLGYNAYLRSKGYEGENPWELYANSALDESGQRISGWNLRHADKPALVAEEHSETAFTTNRAIEFIDQMGKGGNADQGWCLHLSYIKPHWPLQVPAPYHNLYGPEHVLRVRQSDIERENPHPVYQAFMAQEYSQSYAREEVRQRVIPAYMGLIKQLDDHLGRLFAHLEEKGLMQTTMIVFTSDHGDYLGDHWLGEKDLFHEPSVKIPLIVYDPSREADSNRGIVDERFVEAIDLLPTFVEFAGGIVQQNRVEGHSLLPLLRGDTVAAWREYAISEIDYSDRGVRQLLDLHPYDCRAYMICTKEWKYILYEKYRPQLFDRTNDPDEFVDLGGDPAYEAIRQEMHEKLFTWLRRRRTRTELPLERLFQMSPELDEKMGIVIGRW